MNKNWYSLALVILLILFGLSGCSSSDNSLTSELGAELEFSVIAEGDLTNYDSDIHNVKRTEIYRTNQSLVGAMDRYLENSPVLTVNFETKQAVLITLGVQANIGSRFRVDSVVEFEKYVKIEVVYEATGPDCIQLGAINHPYKILEISSRKILIIEEQFELQDCAG